MGQRADSGGWREYSGGNINQHWNYQWDYGLTPHKNAQGLHIIFFVQRAGVAHLECAGVAHFVLGLHI